MTVFLSRSNIHIRKSYLEHICSCYQGQCRSSNLDTEKNNKIMNSFSYFLCLSDVKAMMNSKINWGWYSISCLMLYVSCIMLQYVDKLTRCNTSYEWSLLFIIWLYMFRTITSPSSGASSRKLYNALVCSCHQASLAVWTQQLDSPARTYQLRDTV